MGKGDFRIHINHCHYGTDRPRIADATPAIAMHGFFDQRAWPSPISRQSESRPALDEAGCVQWSMKLHTCAGAHSRWIRGSRRIVDNSPYQGRRRFKSSRGGRRLLVRSTSRCADGPHGFAQGGGPDERSAIGLDAGVRCGPSTGKRQDMEGGLPKRGATNCGDQ